MNIRNIILTIILVLSLSGCGAFVEEQEAIDAMEALGFTDVKVINTNWVFPSWVGCGDKDCVMFETVGNREGKKVTATICCGFLKKCTVRF